MLLGQSIGLHVGRREILKIAPLLLVNNEKGNVKFCKDCKFFKNDLPQTKFGHCSHFPTNRVIII